jgi:hypothetical protein
MRTAVPVKSGSVRVLCFVLFVLFFYSERMKRTEVAAPGKTSKNSRIVRVLRVFAYILVALSVTVITGLGVARATVLDREWYDSVLEKEKAYDRLYDQVLTDPALADVTRDLLARLPVPANQITANLRLVVPPSTLRGMADAQINRTLQYLRGEDGELHLVADLKPIVNNLGAFAETFVGDTVGKVPRVTSENAPQFTETVAKALEELANGRTPANLPSLDISPADAPAIADTLIEKLPENRRAGLRDPVIAALQRGDLGGVLGTIVPALLGDKVTDARLGLAEAVNGQPWDLTIDVTAKDLDLKLGPLPKLRAFTSLGLGWVLAGAWVLALLGLFALWKTAPVRGLGRLRAPAAAFAAGGGIAALIGLLLWPQVQVEADGAERHWAPSVVSLVDDLANTAIGSIRGAWFTASLVPIFYGGAVVTVLGRYRRRHELTVRRRWVRTATVGVAVAAAAALAVTIFVPGPTASGGKDDARRCNGSAQLCDRHYDQVTSLATHNSMSTTQDRFFSPLQDPDLITQLDAGARGLLVDSYRWETPEEIGTRLADANLDPAVTRTLTGIVDKVAPARPGLWFCHVLCRSGAIPMVDTLKRINEWLDRNPDEVVTMVIQDAITGVETEQAFKDAGLVDKIATPPADPEGKWPTLGKMIETNKRLVVFAERADGPAPWYRNFYKYGMETPYSYATPAEMNCVPNRGGTDKNLFLLNNFITAGGGSRTDAGLVNSEQFVLDRARKCEKERGHTVNFVAVDFATIGQARRAVDTLNVTRDKKN